MEKKKPPFTDPAIRKKAELARKAKGGKRPNRKSKARLIEETKKELITKELLANGFLERVGSALPKIDKALIASAQSKHYTSAQDRKTVYTALGILTKDDREVAKGIGEILANLMAEHGDEDND